MKMISMQQYLEGRERRFGIANPERIYVAFWEWAVRTGHSAWKARKILGASPGGKPDWCFDRFGMTRTALPDGRVVYVAGEHEDWYDSDFCIYNDVVVLTPEGDVQFCIYPEAAFPPTDFHSATLVDESIYLIGNVGYGDARRPGETPVRVLDLRTMEIRTLSPSGAAPGWIGRHSAELDRVRQAIDVFSGNVLELHNGEERFRKNVDRHRLDLASLTWSRIEWNPGASEWRINVRPDDPARRKQGHAPIGVAERVDRSPIPDAMAAKAMKEPGRSDGEDQWRLRWRGVWLEITNKWDHEFHIVVRGELPPDALREMLDMWTDSLRQWSGVDPWVKKVWPPDDSVS
ncbi:MAG: hypothetical protein ACKVZJ_02610 [Phycisphaerales bacterium]